MSARDKLDPALLEQLEAEKAKVSPDFEAIALDENKMRPPSWAWSSRILNGALNGLTGPGGIGKGTLAAYIIANLTQGTLSGDLLGEPVNVMVVGDEDDVDEVWTPRIKAAGGDVSRVWGLNYTSGVPLDLVRDKDALKAEMQEHDIKVLYFDQVLDHIGPDLNAHGQKDVRLALAPARGIARELGCAVLYSQHPNKGQGESSLRNRTGGSGQFVDLPRSGLLLGWHPEEDGKRALARGKGNVGEIPPALTFDIQSTLVVNPETKQTIEVGVIQGIEEDAELSPEQILSEPPRERGPSKEDQCRTHLMGIAADHQWRRRRETQQTMAAMGFSEHVFRRVFDSLEKETRKDGREIEWRLL